MNDIVFYDMMKYVNVKMKIEKMCCLNNEWMGAVWKGMKGTNANMDDILKIKKYYVSGKTINYSRVIITNNAKIINKNCMIKMLKYNIIAVTNCLCEWVSDNGYTEIIPLLLDDDE